MSLKDDGDFKFTSTPGIEPNIVVASSVKDRLPNEFKFDAAALIIDEAHESSLQQVGIGGFVELHQSGGSFSTISGFGIGELRSNSTLKHKFWSVDYARGKDQTVDAVVDRFTNTLKVNQDSPMVHLVAQHPNAANTVLDDIEALKKRSQETGKSLLELSKENHHQHCFIRLTWVGHHPHWQPEKLVIECNPTAFECAAIMNAMNPPTEKMLNDPMVIALVSRLIKMAVEGRSVKSDNILIEAFRIGDDGKIVSVREFLANELKPKPPVDHTQAAFPKLDRECNPLAGPAWANEFPGWMIEYCVQVPMPGGSTHVVSGKCAANIKEAGWIWNGGKPIDAKTRRTVFEDFAMDVDLAIMYATCTAAGEVTVGPCVVRAVRAS